ncbi:MAG: CDP-diacylglycerol--glycerol-3-phosphate 3-phosphatidyltransferase [Acidobacteriaceae bacterium]
MNLPNSITMSRIVCVPLLIWMLSASFPFRDGKGEQELIAAAIFLLLSATDGVDGYLARKRGQVTTMGMLLDPLADKLMISAAFISLVEFTPSIMKPWIAVLVIGREFLVSGLRSIASAEGFTIQASNLGKLKTIVQIVSVIATIIAHRWYALHFGWYVFPIQWTAYTAIYFMVLVSIISAVDYFVAFWKKIDHASSDRREATRVLSRHTKKNLPATNHLL